MIRHSNLYNPIKQTRVMSTSFFGKYIVLRNMQITRGTTATPEQIYEIRNVFFNAHPYVPADKLLSIWDHINLMVENNAALAQFILDQGGAKSDFFFPWLVSVATSPSAALEMAYGFGYDLNGEWREVPSEDEITDFVLNVPTFVFQRERQLLMADLVASARDNGKDWTPAKVVDLGAGRMAWARYHGLKLNGDSLDVIAVDKDTGIKPEELFGKEPTTISISYEKADILPWLSNCQPDYADLIMLGGVASYYPLPFFTEAVLKPVYSILRPGGSFFFDLQLECPQYTWTTKLFGWPEMKLMQSATQAITEIEAIRRQLWRDGFKFGAEYSVDTYNENPSAVMIVLSKI